MYLLQWKKKPKEPLPWYRAPNFDGNLTEDEKQELDSFRYREESQGVKHPAADCGDLPTEVMMYISKLEIELYDEIQDRLVGRCLLVSGIGAFALAKHFGWFSLNYNSPEVFFIAAALLVVPWFYYPIKWRNNADRYIGDTNEEIRKEWELEYIVSKKMPSEPRISNDLNSRQS
jgi:hypothetical protein